MDKTKNEQTEETQTEQGEKGGVASRDVENDAAMTEDTDVSESTMDYED